MIDAFSKICAIIPLKTLDSSEIHNQILTRWIAIYGPPEQLHSDRATNLNLTEIQELCKRFNIRKTATSPYHPQGNGQCERLFRTVKDMIYCTTKSQQQTGFNLYRS